MPDAELSCLVFPSFSLSEMYWALTQSSPVSTTDPASVLLAYVYLYDQRGGGVETSFKGDHQGLRSTKRSKKRFEAQQMVILLSSLAHNVVVWAQQWLSTPSSPVRHYGTLRMVRDVFHVSGFLVSDALDHLVHIVLNQAAPLAPPLVDAFAKIRGPALVALSLG